MVNDDGTYTSAKSHGIFGDTLYIKNDLGYVVKKVNAYYNEEEEEEEESTSPTEN